MTTQNLNLNKKEIHVSCDKVGREDHGNSVNHEKAKKGYLWMLRTIFKLKLLILKQLFFVTSTYKVLIMNRKLPNTSKVTMQAS